MEKQTEISKEWLGNGRRRVHTPPLRDRTRDHCSLSRDIFRQVTAGPSPITYLCSKFDVLHFGRADVRLGHHECRGDSQGSTSFRSLGHAPTPSSHSNPGEEQMYIVLHREQRCTLHLSVFQRFLMFPTYFRHCSWLSVVKFRCAGAFRP